MTPLLITDPLDRALIQSNIDCQRLAQASFIFNHPITSGTVENAPVRRPLHNTAVFGRFDWTVNTRNQFNASYNFNRSIKINETFDVDTYGNSANGIEGTSRIQVFNANLVSTLTPKILSEAHFTYNREKRPRQAVDTPVTADTAAGICTGPGCFGFGSAYRFGHPFFLNPTIDEIFWRTQIRENISWVAGRHTFKFGGEWIHSLNDQVFRGFFEGRYIFNSVEGFLRYASNPSFGPGFGPTTAGCTDGSFIEGTTLIRQAGPDGIVFTSDDPTPRCSAGPDGMLNTTDDILFNGGPLLLYLQAAGGDGGPATDAAGASKIDNEEYAIFAQDKWQIRPNFTLSYGLRWEAQILPNPVVPPAQTAYAIFLSDPRFPSNGTIPSQKKMFQPRIGLSWDPWSNGKSVFRASWGIFNARQNMLTQVGSITANGVTQQTIFRNTDLATFLASIGVPGAAPTWPGLTPSPGPGASCTAGSVTNPFPCFTGVRVFHRDYRNPRIYVTNVAYEFEVARDTSIYADFTHSKGVYLTRFIDFNRADNGGLFGPFLGEVMVANSFGKSLYRGFTIGVKKRFSDHFQLEGNYVIASDRDDDANERDPFTDRNCNFNNRALDYSYSERDIRHKFNFFGFFELPWKFEANTRMQARSAQPFPGAPALLGRNTDPASLTCPGGARNDRRRDNEFFTFDWRLQRPIKVGERIEIIPTIEMFNTFNNENNVIQDVNSGVVSGAGLFNFDGFLRQGAGDPRQVQLSIKIRW
jgi:hypothetical protein